MSDPINLENYRKLKLLKEGLSGKRSILDLLRHCFPENFDPDGRPKGSPKLLGFPCPFCGAAEAQKPRYPIPHDFHCPKCLRFWNQGEGPCQTRCEENLNKENP